MFKNLQILGNRKVDYKMADANNKNLSDFFDEFFYSSPSSKTSTPPCISEEKYEEKIVAFLDLLGISKQIEDTEKGKNEGEIIKKMKDIKESFARLFDSTKNMDFLYVSDSLICTCNITNLEDVISRLAIFQLNVLRDFHTLLRGAIEYGKVYVDKEGKQIIGPAYIQAYKRQEYEAIFPRIIIGKTVLDSASNKYKLFISRDDEQSIDFIGYYQKIETKSNSDVIEMLQHNKVYEYLLDEYDKHNNPKNLKIRSKYAWMINYLQEKEVWSNDR